jgi:hypothetical protein
MSGLPADSDRRADVRAIFGSAGLYSITSVARTSNEGGTVRPRPSSQLEETGAAYQVSMVVALSDLCIRPRRGMSEMGSFATGASQSQGLAMSAMQPEEEVDSGYERLRDGPFEPIQSKSSPCMSAARFEKRDASRPLIIRAIDLDQCDRIAIRIAYNRKKAYSQRPRSVIMSEETKAEKTQVQILRDAFEGMKGHQPKSDGELNEWLATDEGKLATMFEPTLMSRWGETGHA